MSRIKTPKKLVRLEYTDAKTQSAEPSGQPVISETTDMGAPEHSITAGSTNNFFRSTSTQLLASLQKHTLELSPVWKERNMIAQQRVLKFLQGMFWQTLVMGVTLYAIYAEDIKAASLPQSADDAVGYISAVALLVFLVEFVLLIWCDHTYRFSFFFFLDMLAILSMVPDIPWLVAGLGLQDVFSATETRAGRAARLGTKSGRVLRLVRLVRITRIIKTAIGLLRSRLHLGAHPVTGRQRGVSVVDAKAKRKMLVQNETEGDGVKAKRLGSHLLTLITNKVICVVLCVMLFTGFLQPSDDGGEFNINPIIQQMSYLHTQVPESMSEETWQTYINQFQLDHSPQNINARKYLIYLEVNGDPYLDENDRINELRPAEKESYTHEETYAVFDVKHIKESDALLSILQTTFLVLILIIGAAVFSSDTNQYVIFPIEAMLQGIAQIGLLEDDDEELTNEDGDEDGKTQKVGFETDVIKTAINRMKKMLALGFGVAGQRVIQKYISQNKIDVISDGINVNAIFGFCDIRNFTDATECLNERVMTFVNRIADIVHGITEQFCGAPNKNIGDAFLLVWKISADKEAPKALSRAVSQIADKALMAALKIHIEIGRSSHLKEYANDPAIMKRMPGYRVKLGFGLHAGWAIEGAIGSIHKIDASYLSPNVNLSARLESATKQFGVPLLLSGDFVKLLSSQVRKRCRHIDTVTVKGSNVPIQLWTCDIIMRPEQNNRRGSIPFIPSGAMEVGGTGEHGHSRRRFSYDLGTDPFLLDDDLKRIHNGAPQDFFKTFDEAFRLYTSGDWIHCSKELETCLQMQPDDGPTKTLLTYVSKHAFQAPEDWAGYRCLTEK